MGLAVSITVGSTIQISLLVAPVLVIVSALIGHPMNLVFSSPLELIAIGAVVFAINAIAHDGETTWFEGVLLLAIYVLFGLLSTSSKHHLDCLRRQANYIEVLVGQCKRRACTTPTSGRGVRACSRDNRNHLGQLNIDASCPR